MNSKVNKFTGAKMSISDLEGFNLNIPLYKLNCVKELSLFKI